jgi:ribosomal protein L7/L12/uncharacterized protein YegL
MSLDFDATLDRPTLPPGMSGEVRCQLTIRPSIALAAAAPVTTSICLVFDCSASMQGQKLETAIRAAQMIVRSVDPRHTLSLVGFQGRTHVLLENGHATPGERDAMIFAIEGIRAIAGGSTNTASGIEEGARLLAASAADARVLILLSDGQANDPARAERAAKAATDAGVQLFAVGIGADYEADHLLKLVTPSNGAVFGESHLDEIESLFAGLLGRIESFVATGASLSIELGEGVRAGAAYKTSPEQAFLGVPASGRITLNVGNVERVATYGFMLVLQAPPRTAGTHRLARAVLRYDIPALGLRGHEREVAVDIEYSEAAAEVRSSAVMESYRAAHVAELGQSLAEAHHRHDLRRMAECLDQLRDAGDAGLRARCDALRAELDSARRLKRDGLNGLLVATTAKREPEPTVRVEAPPPEPEPTVIAAAPEPEPTLRLVLPAKPAPSANGMYDVLLLEAGPMVIKLVRELRDATGLTLPAVRDLVQATPSAVRSDLALPDAEKLVARLAAAGARAEVRPSAA